MEFDEIVVKESPGLCRCCLSEGCYKDLGSEYTWMNDTEVYADMLLECFDISISQHNDGPNGANRLICEVCITRLRDACNFKKQVLDSEKKFIDMVARGEFRPKVLVYQTQTMKPEPTNEEQHRQENEIEYLEDEMDFGDDEPLKQIEALDEVTEDPTVSEDIMVATLPVKGKRGRPRKSDTPAKPERKAKVPKLEEKPRSSKAIVKEKPKDIGVDNKMLMYQIREKMSLFLTTIIENSTILPFRWHSNKYMCFYCRCPFHESSKLKEHTKTEHRGSNLKSVMRFLLKGDPSAVKLDISEIACKKCPKLLSDLDDFLVHASDAHDLKFDHASSANLFAFKLSDDEMKCLECDQTFQFFGPLVRHVHKYHNKLNSSFLCDICGQSFVAKANVLSHIKNMHAITECYYDDCDETFRTQYALKKHLENVHMKEKLKCPKCPEILGSRYLKKRHLALVHDVKSVQFGCDQCDKIFTLRSKLVSHKQRIHLKEKKIACEICGFKVYNVDLLKRHMVRHDDSRPFECDICRKAFQRKKTLDYHKRIHTNDRRHVCKECGAAFIQPSSLKLHVRVHHSKVSETGPWT